MDQIDEIAEDYVQVKGEQSILLKLKGDKERDAKVVLTNPVSKESLEEQKHKKFVNKRKPCC